MMGHTHVMGGAAFWLTGAAVAGAGPVVTFGGLGIAAFVGALAPDIDHRKAEAAQFLRAAGLAIVLAAVAAGLTGVAGGSRVWEVWAALGAFAGLLPWLVRPRCGGGFRGVVHSQWGLLAVVVTCLLVVVLTPVPVWCGVALVVGWCSHLVLDALTAEGLRWDWPDQSRFGIFPRRISMRTGGPKLRRGRRRGGKRRRTGTEYKIVQPVLLCWILLAGWAVVSGGLW
jgi:membrane-bound metal-dependent hydrolase YbcI (DUF457 family)